MTSWHRKNGNSWTLLPPWSPGSFPSDYFCITCGWPKSAPARAFASLLLSAFCYLIAKQIHQRRNKRLCHTIAVHPPKAANGKKGTLDIWVISKNSGPWKSRQNVKRGKKNLCFESKLSKHRVEEKWPNTNPEELCHNDDYLTACINEITAFRNRAVYAHWTHHFVHEFPSLLHSPAISGSLLGRSDCILNSINNPQNSTFAGVSSSTTRISAIHRICHLES